MSSSLVRLLLLVVVVAVGGWFALNLFNDEDGGKPHETSPATQAQPEHPANQGAAPVVESSKPTTSEPTEQTREEVRVASNPETSGSGMLSGRVVNEQGNPVAKANVELYVGPNSPAFALIGARQTTGIATTTDDDGVYTLEKVAPGSSYTVVATHPDYAQGERTSVALGEGEGEAQLVQTIVMTQGARIFGTVVAQAGGPVSDAKVELWNTLESNFADPASRKAPWKETKTDAEGKYEFKNVHFTAMEVVVSKEGFATLSKNNTVLFAQVDDKEIGFELSPSQDISGQVSDAHGRPIKDATIEAWQVASPSDKGSSKSRVVTGADGYFTLTGLAAGNYAVSAKAKGYSDKQNGQTAAGTSGLAIQMEARGSVSGRVKAPDGSPVEKFTLRLMMSRADGGVPAEAVPTSTPPQEFKGASGSFSFVDVEPGEYVLQAEASGFAPSESPRFTAEREKTIQGLEITMRAGGKVSGTVVDGSNKPLRGARVKINTNQFVDNPIQQLFEQMPGTFKQKKIETRTDESGHFELTCLVPGVVQVAFDSSACSPKAINDVTITEGQSTELGQVVLTAGGTISVSCVDDAGKPLADATVNCTSGVTQTSRRPDYDGKVLFTNLAPGKWELTIMPEKGNPLINVIQATKSKQEVMVREGATSQVTLRVGPANN